MTIQLTISLDLTELKETHILAISSHVNAFQEALHAVSKCHMMSSVSYLE